LVQGYALSMSSKSKMQPQSNRLEGSRHSCLLTIESQVDLSTQHRMSVQLKTMPSEQAARNARNTFFTAKTQRTQRRKIILLNVRAPLGAISNLRFLAFPLQPLPMYFLPATFPPSIRC
jgi:hypothetical protein